MKIYLSADIEGVAGITSWDEATSSHPYFAQFQKLLTLEVLAACEGAHAAGAAEIYLQDAHSTGRNILLEPLPPYVKIIRGWSESPMEMLQELDQSFDAILLVGWHARAGSEANPLAHTLTNRISEVRINGTAVSEFSIHAYLAEYSKVPIAFISGDASVCGEAQAYNSAIHVAAVSQGVGASTISLSPKASQQLIRAEVAKSLSQDLSTCRKPLPDKFVIDVSYASPHHAYKFSWYPGAKHVGNRTISFSSEDFFEIKRFLQFVSM